MAPPQPQARSTQHERLTRRRRGGGGRDPGAGIAAPRRAWPGPGRPWLAFPGLRGSAWAGTRAIGDAPGLLRRVSRAGDARGRGPSGPRSGGRGRGRGLGRGRGPCRGRRSAASRHGSARPALAPPLALPSPPDARRALPARPRPRLRPRPARPASTATCATDAPRSLPGEAPGPPKRWSSRHPGACVQTRARGLLGTPLPALRSRGIGSGVKHGVKLGTQEGALGRPCERHQQRVKEPVAVTGDNEILREVFMQITGRRFNATQCHASSLPVVSSNRSQGTLNGLGVDSNLNQRCRGNGPLQILQVSGLDRN